MKKFQKTILLPFVLALSFFAFSYFPKKVSAIESSKTYSVEYDSFINEAYPSSNQGSSSTLIVSSKPTTRYSLIKFKDLYIPSGATIKSANLKFYVYDYISTSGYKDNVRINVIMIDDDWTESGVKWSDDLTMNVLGGADLYLSIKPGWKTIPVTDIVNKWYSGSVKNRGLRIQIYDANGMPESGSFSIKSKDSGDNVPILEVDYDAPLTINPGIIKVKDPIVINPDLLSKIAGSEDEDSTESNPPEGNDDQNSTTGAEKEEDTPEEQSETTTSNPAEEKSTESQDLNESENLDEDEDEQLDEDGDKEDEEEKNETQILYLVIGILGGIIAAGGVGALAMLKKQKKQ